MLTGDAASVGSSERTMRLTSWGRTCRSTSARHFATSREDITRILALPPASGLIARGLARSYGDCCLNDGGGVVDTTGLSAIRSFDATTGRVVCEAGVSLRALSAFALERGWALPVYPGTGFVTLGGAIANDVHGKEQHRVGTIGDAVHWFDLATVGGSVRRVIREDDRLLFAATVGGIGLTGIIVAAELQLVRALTNAVVVVEQRAPDLETVARMLEAHASEYPSMVAWLDFMSSRSGRGVVEFSRPADHDIASATPRSIVTVPRGIPNGVVNRGTIAAFNAFYFRRIPTAGRVRTVHRSRFVFPLDALGEWHRVYGRAGLYQFQCCLPVESAVPTFAAMRAELLRARIGSTLAVMKWVGRRGTGLLSFTRPGLSLALDFVGGASTVALIHRLQQHALRAGGTVYLAKDSCLRPDEFAEMYPELPRFRETLRRVDPSATLQSDMSRRLAVHAL